VSQPYGGQSRSTTDLVFGCFEFTKAVSAHASLAGLYITFRFAQCSSQKASRMFYMTCRLMSRRNRSWICFAHKDGDHKRYKYA
jgi:hypothetical protein